VSGVLSFPLDTEFFLVENLKCRNDKTQKKLEFWYVLGPKLKKNLKKTRFVFFQKLKKNSNTKNTHKSVFA